MISSNRTQRPNVVIRHYMRITNQSSTPERFEGHQALTRALDPNPIQRLDVSQGLDLGLGTLSLDPSPEA